MMIYIDLRIFYTVLIGNRYALLCKSHHKTCHTQGNTANNVILVHGTFRSITTRSNNNRCYVAVSSPVAISFVLDTVSLNFDNHSSSLMA